MKQLLATCIAIAFTTANYGQTNPYTYLEKNSTDWWSAFGESVPLLMEYNLKGNIRSYQLAEYQPADSFKSRSTTQTNNKEVFFNEQHQITAEQYNAPDGFITWETIYQDYTRQRIKNYRGFRRRGGVRSIDSSAYNEKGILVYEGLADSIGKTKYAYSYEISQAGDTTIVRNNKFVRLRYVGNRKVYEFFPVGDRKGEYEWLHAQGDSVVTMRYGGNGRLYEKSVTDQAGREKRRVQYDESGAIEQVWLRVYNEQGHLRYEDYYYRDEDGRYSKTYRTTYTYKGLQLQSVENPLTKVTTRFKYNEQGDVISGEEGKKQIVYQYKYDDRGNWIQRDELADGKTIGRLKRVITYY